MTHTASHLPVLSLNRTVIHGDTVPGCGILRRGRDFSYHFRANNQLQIGLRWRSLCFSAGRGGRDGGEANGSGISPRCEVDFEQLAGLIGVPHVRMATEDESES